jgi:D-alanine-D-alanine ligase
MLRVAVLMGGKSAEREVSLSTGRQVLAALDPSRYQAFPVDTAYLAHRALPGAARPLAADSCGNPAALVPEDPFAALPAPAEPPLTGQNRPDVAVICLHGKFGEDGTIQGMLELLEIPYTGSGVLASALAMDKTMSKKLMALEGIPVPPGITVRGRAEADAYLAALRAGRPPVDCPAVVKPSRQGSTIGISIVRDPDTMAAALHTALHYDDEVLIERCIEGMEITAPILGNDDLTALPLVEIVPNGGFYDYEAKYTPGATDEICPARLSPEVTREAQELAKRAHRALGCRGVSRTDMIVAEDGIWVLEVNTIPGMTPTSLLPRSAAAAGLSFAELVERLVQLALEGRTRETTPAAV